MVRTNTHRAAKAGLVAFALLAAPLAALAQSAPSLGSAADFGVLANGAVTCTDSVINGNVGIFALGTSVTQTRCPINGTINAGDATAAAAYADFVTAYDSLALAQCDAVLSGTLSGQTLPPGVYCFDAAATLTGQLTLDGPPTGIWIFKVGTGATGALTGTGFSVVMAGGAQPCNVYWRVAEATTMTASAFQGNILAGAATTFTGGSLIGRDLTMADATLTGVAVTSCVAGTPQPPTDNGDCKGDHKRHHEGRHEGDCKDHDKSHHDGDCKDHDKKQDQGHDKKQDQDHDKGQEKGRNDRR